MGMSFVLPIPGFHEMVGAPELPTGVVYEVYGEENSGKTSVALHFIRALQANPWTTTVFIDGEHSITRGHFQQYGIDTQRVHFAQPQTMDIGLKLLTASAQQRIAGLVVIDGLNAMPTEMELSESLGGYSKRSEREAARLITKSFQSLISTLWDQGATVLVLNQIRHRPGLDGVWQEFVSGGRLLPILCPLRIRMGNPVVHHDPTGTPTHFSADLAVTRNRLQPGKIGSVRADFPFITPRTTRAG